jgi:mannonate dehydratase
MEHTWRWYGPKDPITLKEIKQTGASGIVTALHHIPPGETWPEEEIMKMKHTIEAEGFRWSVVESLPVHGDIKIQKGRYQEYIENYKKSLRNLGSCGVRTVTYNFIPMLDWLRTDADWTFPDSSKALRFDMHKFAAFDLFMLQRPGSENSYSEKIQKKAAEYFKTLDEKEKEDLKDTVLLSLPGSGEKFEPADVEEMLKDYEQLDHSTFQQHLFHFLREVVPVAEESGVRLAVHADDPPMPLFDVPRVVSTRQDALDIIHAVDSPSNGLALCTGSFGAGHFNDLAEMASQLAHRVNFAHLRNVTRDEDGNFYEDNHLDGNIDLYRVIKALLLEEQKRKKAGRGDWQIPMRPDHGHQMLDDLHKTFYPGYSLIGRMRGLAELRGLEMGIQRCLEEHEYKS